MTNIPDVDRDVMEQSFYLPMLLTVLERDRTKIQEADLKLHQPYLNLIEETIKAVQKDYKEVKVLMRKRNMRVDKVGKDDAFTQFSFFYKGYESKHNYFNPRIRNKITELLEYYLINFNRNQPY